MLLGYSLLMNLSIANAAAAVVIRRINFPRNLTRAMTRAEVERAVPQSLLSEHDEQEVRQTVALVLVRAGIPVSATANPLLGTMPAPAVWPSTRFLLT